MRLLLLAALLALSGAARAQQPGELTREYLMTLAHVYAEMENLRFTKEICSDAFPELAPAAEAAFQGWSSKYGAFVEEIRSRWSAAAARLARKDPADPGLMARFDVQLQRNKTDLGVRLRSAGPEQFRKGCETFYPALLATPRGNLEHYLAAQVGTIRRGHGENFVRADTAGRAAERQLDGIRLAEFPAAGEPAVVRLLEAGTGDRQELRVRLDPGSTHVGLMTMYMSMAVEVDGQRPRPPQMPGVELAMAFKVTEADAQQTRVEFSIREAPRLLGTEGVEPKLVDAMRAGFGALQALRGYVVASTRGVTREVHLEPLAGADERARQMIQSMQQSMDQISVPLPVEAVGVGARWKTLQHSHRNGFDLYQVASYEVTRIEGAVLSLAVAIEQFGPTQEMRAPGQPPGTSMELVRMKSAGRGETTMNLRSPVPRAKASFQSEMVMNLRAENLLSQTAVNMEMQMRFEPADAR